MALISTLLAVAVFAALGEWVLAYRYDRWRATFEVEVLQKSLAVASDNEALIWEYRPYGEYIQPLLKTVTKTNRFGFRQHDSVTREKSGSVTRIAFVGDSVTLGREVDFEKTFPEISQNLLNSGELTIEALNFGIDGYNTIQVSELCAQPRPRFLPRHNRVHDLFE